MIAIILSLSLIIVKENKYENTYENGEKLKIEATIKSNPQKTEYGIEFLAKTEKGVIQVTSKEKENIEYGDKIILSGEYQKIRSYKNRGVFNYSESLKKENIFGNVKAEKIEKVGKSKDIYKYFANTNKKIKNKIDKNFKKQTSSILNSLIIGNKNDLEPEVSQTIQQNGLSHILAISGMHVSCITIIFQKILERFSNDNRKKKISIIIILIIYGLIIGFMASAVRAIIMAILAIAAKIVYRKNNHAIDIAIACLMILIYNPYYLIDSGFLLSFGATIGIIYIFPIINKIKGKIIKYFFEIFLVSVSVNISIFPIIIYFFKRISISFFITGLIMTPLVFLIEFLGIIIIFIPSQAISIISPVIEITIKIFLEVAKINLGGFYFKVPNILEIVIYYLILLIFLEKDMRNFFKKLLKNLLILLIIINLVINITEKLNKDLKIYFIDVGQGDSTLIQTPKKLNILIDGGGSEQYDVGENVLVPYLLSRKINKIDYVLISHFDTDHVRSD